MGEEGEAVLKDAHVGSYLESEIRGRGIDQKHPFAHSWLSLVGAQDTTTLPHTDASPEGQNLDFSSKWASGSRASPQPLQCENQ